jgi:hypothetical protein
MRFAAIAISVFITFAAGCRLMQHAKRPVPSYQSEEFQNIQVRRVVLVPFVDEAGAGNEVAVVERAFVEEFQKATAVELIGIDMQDDRFANNDNPRRTGKYKIETILELAIRHGADAVLFGAVTALRPYPPQSLGLRLDLISANSGLALWNCSAHFDMADRDAKSSIEASFNKFGNGGGESLTWDLTLSSPSRFASLVAREAVATLKGR